MTSTRTRLSTLWIFATLNYLYCDVVTLMDSSNLKGFLAGSVGAIDVTPGFLLGAAVLVEIPIAMVLLSRALGDRSARMANIVAGAVMTLVQAASLFVSTPAPYYAFFSVIEIASTLAVVWYASRWSRTARPFGAGADQTSGAM